MTIDPSGREDQRLRGAQPLSIRRAEARDAAGLAGLYHVAYAGNANAGFPMSAASVSVAEVLAWIERDIVFAADRRDEPVGVVRLRYRDDWRRWVLGRLAVAPSKTGGGIGAALIGHAEKHGAASGWDSITLTTPSHHPFLPNWYRRMGYRDTGHRDLPDLPYDEIIFEKSLGQKLSGVRRRHRPTAPGRTER